MVLIKPNRSLILPQRSEILKEASLRILNAGELMPGVPLRSSQYNGTRGLHDFIDTTSDEFERRHAYADMATASGKTGMFGLLSRHAFRIAQERGIGDAYRTLIVEPSTFMLTQTRDAMEEITPELKGAIGMYGGDSRDLSRPITIITYESWVALLESGQLNGADIALNINDESHKGLSERRQKMINEVLTEAYHLGFTASAEYDQDKTMKLTHRNRFYHLPLKDAINEDTGLVYFAHVQYAVLRLLPNGTKAKRGSNLDNIDFTALKRTQWSRLVTHAYREGMDGVTGQALSDKIALFFTADTAHADFTADMLNKDPVLKRKAKEKGFKDVAVSIHSVDMTGSEQDRRMKAFQNGQYMAAVGDKKFQAGLNHPPVKFISSYPGSSLVDTVQEIGRGMRQYFDPITGEEQGAVIFETIPYIGDPDPAADAAAKRKALRSLITARDVLGEDTLVLRQGRDLSLKLPSKGPRGVRIPLSSGATAEMFMTHEETLTVSRDVDIQRSSSKKLTKELILNYIQATYDKTGTWLSIYSKEIWQQLPNGDYMIVDGESAPAINHALANKGRGLIEVDGSAIASSLADFLIKNGFKETKLPLTADVVKNYIQATYDQTGEWLNQDSNVVWQQLPNDDYEIVKGETGSAINHAFRKKHRGLVDSDGSAIASSLADFLIKNKFKESNNRPPLTADLIKNYIKATHYKTGKWLSGSSEVVWQELPNGDYAIVDRETGASINQAFVRKQRGLIENDGSPVASSLADFLIKNGFKNAKIPLTVDLVKNYIQATYDQTGTWLTEYSQVVWEKLSDGSYKIVRGETGGAINAAFTQKGRGLKNADGSAIAKTLVDFRQQHGFVDNSKRVKTVKATQEKTILVPGFTNKSDASVTRQDVVDLFVQLSGNLVERIATELAPKMQVQPPVVSTENSNTPPPWTTRGCVVVAESANENYQAGAYRNAA